MRNSESSRAWGEVVAHDARFEFPDAIAFADGEDFHAEATIAGLLLAAGVIGLLRDWRAG